MKILDANQFVSERMKIRPVTNAEWEEAKETIKSITPVKLDLSTIKSVDDLQLGWLLQMNDNNIRIAISLEYATKIFLKENIKCKWCFIRLGNNNDPVYVPSDSYEHHFPEHYINSMFNIKAVYKYFIPDLKNICESRQSFAKWYLDNMPDLTKYLEQL